MFPSVNIQFYSALPHENPMFCMYSFGEEITNYHVIRQNFHDALEEMLERQEEIASVGNSKMIALNVSLKS